MSALATANTLSGKDIYVLLKDDRYLKIQGALSRVAVDVDCYDGSTYSQLVDASILGNSHKLALPAKGASTKGEIDWNNAAIPTGLSSLPALIELPGAESQTYDTDSAFVLTTTPGRTMKTRTLIQWFSATSGGGELVGEAWLDRISGWSNNPPMSL